MAFRLTPAIIFFKPHALDSALPHHNSLAAHELVLQLRVCAADSVELPATGKPQSSMDPSVLGDLSLTLVLVRCAVASDPAVCAVLLDGLAAVFAEADPSFAAPLVRLTVGLLLDTCSVARNAACVALVLEHPTAGLLALAGGQTTPPTETDPEVERRRLATVAAAEALAALRLCSTEAASVVPLATDAEPAAVQHHVEVYVRLHATLQRTRRWLPEMLVNALHVRLSLSTLAPVPPPTGEQRRQDATDMVTATRQRPASAAGAAHKHMATPSLAELLATVTSSVPSTSSSTPMPTARPRPLFEQQGRTGRAKVLAASTRREAEPASPQTGAIGVSVFSASSQQVEREAGLAVMLRQQLAAERQADEARRRAKEARQAKAKARAAAGTDTQHQ